MFYRMLFDRFVDVVFCTLSLTCLDKFNAYVLTHDAVLCFVNNSLATEKCSTEPGLYSTYCAQRAASSMHIATNSGWQTQCRAVPRPMNASFCKVETGTNPYS